MSSLRLALKQSLEESGLSQKREDDQSDSEETQATGTSKDGNNNNNNNGNLAKEAGTDSPGSSPRSTSHKKDTRAKHPQATKSRTIPAPSIEVLEWNRSMPVKRARKHVKVGLRVKVRFATKVRRDGKIVKKIRWFGGRISAVSKEGSKIRIKYDDGTAEVAKFPDKDVVVDDTHNGTHAITADRFTPPANTPQVNDEGDQEAVFEEDAKKPPAEEQEETRKPNLTIRIPNIIARETMDTEETTRTKIEADQSQTTSKVAQEKVSPGGKKRAREVESATEKQEEPPNKRIHIHIKTKEEEEEEETSTERPPEKLPPKEEEIIEKETERTEIEQEIIEPKASLEETNEVHEETAPVADEPMETPQVESTPEIAEQVENEQHHSVETPAEESKQPVSPMDHIQKESEEEKVQENTEEEECQSPPPATSTTTTAVLPATADINEPSSEVITEEKQQQEDEKVAHVEAVEGSNNSQSTSLDIMVPSSEDVKANKAVTPRGKPKKENAELMARSGRRAAQQANERIATGEVIIQDIHGKKRRKKRRGGDDSGEEFDEDSQWVQCDSCGKWRVIPASAVETLPSQWYCGNNIWDAKRASCDAPEQSARNIAKHKKRKKRRLQGNEEDTVEGEQVQSPIPGLPSSFDDVASHGDSETDLKAERKGVVKRGKGSFNNILPMDEPAQVSQAKPRGRGRPRRNPPKESEPTTAGASHKTGEEDNLEWVQCEKCDKWRKLPPHISADELPDVWYCSMNTWNPTSASCDSPEDKAEGQVDGAFGTSGANSNKLSFRNLIFGNNGKRASRPISERTRAAESIFNTASDEDMPPYVMYANSSAFVCRAKNHHNENDGLSMLDLMENSTLFAHLRNGVCLGKQNFDTFDKWPDEMKESVKDLILHLLGTSTLTGDEVLLEAQDREWDGFPQGWAAVRPYFHINVVVMALCEMVKDGILEVIDMSSPFGQPWNPRYRRAKIPIATREMFRSNDAPPEESGCMKITKPWKRAGAVSSVESGNCIESIIK